MFNQLEYNSCIKSVDRIGPRGHIVFRGGEIIRREGSVWMPEFGNAKIDRAVTILSSLLRGALHSGRTVSLGLSGGFDSRLLLAMLMRMNNHGFGVHTFGDTMDPDVRIPSTIAQVLGIESYWFGESLPDVDTTVSMLRQFVAQTCLIEPASSFVKLRYYSRLREAGRLMIDGGFGEIARRQYLNRVASLGRSALRMRDVKKLFSLMRVERGDIFIQDVKDAMEQGARESVARVVSSLPPVTDIGVENSVDLLAIRTRVPNYGAPEQARLDTEVINFMPLVQPSFLRAVFGARVSLRSNGAFFRTVIRANCPILARFALVKSGATYRFGLSTRTAWLITQIKAKLGQRFIDPAPDHFLMHIKEFVLDLAHSSEAVGWPLYDRGKIRSAVQAYFRGGNKGLRSTVDWWVTFELWRRSLSG